MKRTVTRIVAMMTLYNHEITGSIDYKSILEMIDEEIEIDEEFLKELINGVIDNKKEIDHVISINLKNYTLDRLNIVDRNLIRIGVYEFMYSNTPTSIIINELIEISKEYSEIDDYESSKFNNSLLDKIAKGLSDGK